MPLYNPTFIYALLNDEITRAEDLHGVNPNLSDEIWMRILVEEIGEVARAIHENKPSKNIIEELIQVSAVSLRWADERFNRDLR